MMGASSIEWTEATWNPVVGCSKVSPGCGHCYAETFAYRLRSMALAKIAQGKDPGRLRHYVHAVDEHGRWTGRLIPVAEALADPYRWKRPRMVFVNSMSDVFHADVQTSFLDHVFATMYDCQWHTFQVLTKRPERAYQYLTDPISLQTIGIASFHQLRQRDPAKAEIVTRHDIIADLGDSWPLANVWLGISVEDRKAQSRIRDLLHTPAAVRFVSAEPLLGPLDLSLLDPWSCAQRIDWLIIGCESQGVTAGRLGQFASESAWWSHAAELVEQCRRTGVACFVKQGPRDGRVVQDPDQFPAGDWPREFPVSHQGVVSADRH